MMVGSPARHQQDDNSMTTTSSEEEEQDPGELVVQLAEEAVSKRVLQRLDPVWRMLCEAVREYNRGRRQRVGGGQHKTMIPLLRTMADILERLQSQLEGLVLLGSTVATDDPHEGEAIESLLVSSSLCGLMDYITLPLLAVLKSCGAEGACWGDEDSIDLVERSAVWKCMERSCRVLQISLRSIRVDDQEHLPFLKYLTRCIAILPSAQQVDVMRRQNPEAPRLDNGEDCLLCILETIQTVLQPLSSNDIVNGFLPRILDFCIALVEPTSVWSDSMARDQDVGTELQLTALETAQVLLSKVPQPEPWRRVFPGVYAGIYRRILHSIRVSHARKGARQVVLRAVDVLTRLLQLCLYRPREEQRLDQQSLSSFLDNVRSASGSAKSTRTCLPSGGDDDNENAMLSEEDHFFREINQRLPATLTVLTNFLSTAKSSKVREKAVSLHATLLGETRFCWEDEITENLVTTSLEACLVLCWDSDEDVATEARCAVELYSMSAMRDRVAFVAPRVVSLFERLPSIAQCSTREIELEASLKLLLAYLTMNQASAKTLRTAIFDNDVLTSIRKALAMILDLNFDGFGSSQAKSLILVVDDNQTSPQSLGDLKYMNVTTAQYAYRVIRALGAILGPKQSAFFVDACVADLYEACVRQDKTGFSRAGRSQVRWLHEWIGLIKLAQEVLIGSFTRGVESAVDAASNKAAKRRSRILLSLAQSILPLLTTHPLWTLPTDSSTTEPSSRTPEPVRLFSSGVTLLENSLVAAALRGNATCLCGLLGLVGTIIDLLHDDSRSLTPILLYPILEKVGQRNVVSVRNAACSVLQTFALSTGYSDISALIAENMESSLMSSMVGRIRVPGGRVLVLGEELDDALFAVLDCATAVFRISAESLKEQNSPSCSHSMLSYMEELTRELTTRFDHVATSVTSGTTVALKIIQLYAASVLLLRVSREPRTGFSPSQEPQNSPVNDAAPWREILAPYKKESDSTLNPRDGFAAYEKAKLHQSSEKNVDKKYVAEVARDTAFISLVAWRCGYLLSHPSLIVQIQSCEVLMSCFTFLGWVASDEGVDSGVVNGPKTAILRQVHASWPTIQARLKATCSEVTVSSSGSASLVVATLQTKERSSTNVGEQRVYLAKLLDLITAMIVCADDFMVKHFREIVWPRLCEIIRNFSGPCGQTQSVRWLTVSASLDNSAPRLSESETGLVLSAIRCLRLVFCHVAAGKCLCGLIPSAGSLLFPFLDDLDGSIVEECVLALRSMLRIDCDSLWRPLVEMSGQTISTCPLKLGGDSRGSPQRAARPSTSVKSSAIARELLAFIDALPEQTLD